MKKIVLAVLAGLAPVMGFAIDVVDVTLRYPDQSVTLTACEKTGEIRHRDGSGYLLGLCQTTTTIQGAPAGYVAPESPYVGFLVSVYGQSPTLLDCNLDHYDIRQGEGEIIADCE